MFSLHIIWLALLFSLYIEFNHKVTAYCASKRVTVYYFTVDFIASQYLILKKCLYHLCNLIQT